MSTFKTALRMALAHPLYLLIYTVFISLMGVFIAASVRPLRLFALWSRPF